MIFSSIPFLYYFLPIVISVYYLAPKALKNSVLLLSSLVFYGWGEPKYVFLMLATVFFAYVFGLLIEKFKESFLSKLFLFMSVLLCLSSLAYFKYADFFITNFNAALGLSIPLLKLVLPIGISFYTFQIISYLVDVYRMDASAQKNPINLATYVSLFPQLIAGPIVRYSDIEKQLLQRKHNFNNFYHGIRRFIIGFSKKILIANTLGELCNNFTQSTELSVMYYWLYAISYMLQIYYDFSGYSDMAIGLGKLFGFDFLENFNYPFISKSIGEFWRRWHMSLGSWFRDYVYIPLGGNRVNKFRLLFNVFTVWFLTGFWHGAEWNFIIWGLYFGILLTLEKYFYNSFLDTYKFFGHVYVLFFVIVSFIIFASSNLTQAVISVFSMFGFNNLPVVSPQLIYEAKNYAFILIIASFGATPYPKTLWQTISSKIKKTVFEDLLELLFLIILLLVSTAYLADGSFNPFLYFRF